MSTYVKPNNDRFVIESYLNFSDLSNIDITNPDSALTVKGGAFINNDLYVNGTLVVNGDVISLGNTGGTLALNSNISSNLEPANTDTYNLGSTTKYWSSLYVNSLNISRISDGDFASSNTVIEISSATAPAMFLPDAMHGDIKVIIVKEPLATPVVVTPNNATGFTDITFVTEGDSVTMLFANGAWCILSNFRASVI